MPRPDTGVTRESVLAELRAARSALTVNELADRLDLHPNTVRFHLETLVERRQVEQRRGEHRGRGRPAVRFAAAPGMDPQGPRQYRLLAEALVDDVAGDDRPAARAQRAGRAWGGRLVEPGSTDPIDTMQGLLDELGFAPNRLDENRIGLRHCPFLELADRRAEVVCAIHLGLMRGVLATLDADVDVSRLEPFARPDLCVAHLENRRPRP